MLITTEDGALGIIDEACSKTKCDIYKKYSVDSSKNWIAGDGQTVTLAGWVTMFDDRKQALTPYEFSGRVDKDQFKM